jgi:CheY-like chemotaxis protein
MKVLVVDDDLAVAEVIAGMLEDLGCDVEIRDEPQAALDWLAAGVLPDLVISDIRIPGAQNGIDLAKQIRHDHPDMPIILITGYSDRPTDDLKLPVLLKPVSQATLAKMLEGIRAGVNANLK